MFFSPPRSLGLLFFCCFSSPTPSPWKEARVKTRGRGSGEGGGDGGEGREGWVRRWERTVTEGGGADGGG